MKELKKNSCELQYIWISNCSVAVSIEQVCKYAATCKSASAATLQVSSLFFPRYFTIVNNKIMYRQWVPGPFPWG
jgi:hypothetical protein